MNCIIEENFGIKPKKVYMFQMKEHGVYIDKYLRVVESDELYNMLKKNGFDFNSKHKIELNFK